MTPPLHSETRPLDRPLARLASCGLICLLWGCGNVSGQPDAALPIDGAIADAPAPACDVSKPFGAPALVGGINTAEYETWGWLSADQLTIYYVHSPVATPNSDIWVATRGSTSAAFSNAGPLSGLATAAYEERAVLTADGLTLFLETQAVGVNDVNIDVATRVSAAAGFSAHAPVDGINTASTDRNPWISADGLVMYLSSDRAGTFDIFKTTRTSASSPFATPQPVGELNTAAQDNAPVLSQDGLEIFFQSNRADIADFNIYHATRSTPSDGFGAASVVTELADPADDYPTWLSPDRCQLMFASTRTGGAAGNRDLWIAIRPK
jgi:hypothetical protein